MSYKNYRMPLMKRSELHQKLLEQKRRLLKGEHPDPGIVRDFILRSWERSAACGISMDNTEILTLDPGLLRHIQEHHQPLIQCTTEVLKHMLSGIRPFSSNMALANAEGITIAAFIPEGDGALMPYIAPGVLSSENIIGTNGIGTCLAEKRPVEIIGAEHYRRLGENWSCSAAPIFDEEQNIIAVLNVGQHREHYHAHTFGMVKAAAYAISEQMRLRSLLRRQESIIELLDEGILVIARNGIIRMMNRIAAHIMGLQAPETGKNIKALIGESSLPLFRELLETVVPVRDREGRFEFLTHGKACLYSVLPVADTDDVIFVFKESQKVRKLAVRMTGNRATYTFDDIIGRSPKLRKAISEAQAVAPRSSTVLLLGESGTGKELFAQSIHNAGEHASGPFITVNCGAIPRDLLESELFGYEYGAFTGASKSGKPGKFELASGGTIFLDEIGEMPLDAQVALLRLLQNGEVTRVGGSVSRKVDVRVIAATNRNLEHMMKEGTFREDLFYRLNVYPIVIPPLREREGDIRLLSEHFLKTFDRKLNKDVASMDEKVISSMEGYFWPGNVRELENVMERMVHLAKGQIISMTDVPEIITVKNEADRKNDDDATLEGHRHSAEAQHVRKMLLENGGNVRKTAEALGLSRPYVYSKMKSLGIDIAEVRRAAHQNEQA